MQRDIEGLGHRRQDVVAGWHFPVNSPLERKNVGKADKGWMSNTASPVQSPVGASVTSSESTGRSRTDRSSSGANGHSPLSGEHADRLTLSPILKVGVSGVRGDFHATFIRIPRRPGLLNRPRQVRTELYTETSKAV